MSKERAQRRAEREAAAQQRALHEQARRRRQARFSWLRLSRRRRTGTGRPVANAHTKERRATIASVLLVIVVTTYLATRSIPIVVGVLLVAAIATPALASAFLDRSKK